MVIPHARWTLVCAILLLGLYLLSQPTNTPTEQYHTNTNSTNHHYLPESTADHLAPEHPASLLANTPHAAKSSSSAATDWASLTQIARENLQSQRQGASLGPGLALHALDSDRLISSHDPILQLTRPAQRWPFLVREQQQVSGLLQIELEHDGQAEAGRLGQTQLARALQQQLDALPAGLVAQHWTHIEEIDAYFVTARLQAGGIQYFHPLPVSANAAWQRMAAANQSWLTEPRFRELLRSTVLQSRNATQ